MDSHSRLVGWLKVALPLMALAILSTLFLVARKVDPDSALPYAEVDIADRIREPRMTDAAYAGVTKDGSRITVTANEARPGDGTGASAARVAAQLATPDGAHTALTAGALQVRESAGQLLLQQGVLVATSTGYELRTDAMQLALDRTGAESLGPVEGFGPPGRITAGRMQIRPSEAGQGEYLLVFNGRVSLIYDPQPDR